VQPNALLEQLRRAVPHPAGAEGDAADAPAGLARRVPVVDHLLEQRHPRLLPQPASEEDRGVARDRQHGAGGELHGVVDVGEPLRVDPQVELEGGVGALQRHVVDRQLQGIGTVDPDPRRLLAQAPDPVVQGPEAPGVREGGEPQVLGAQGGQDPGHHHPAAVRGGGSPYHGERLGQLVAEGAERPAGQRGRRQVELQVEPVDLQDQPRVGGLGPDLLVARQGARPPVDQKQLQLGADRGRPDAEAGALEEPVEGQQALLEPLLEALVVDRVEPVPVDR
jgi:hypothetical protein